LGKDWEGSTYEHAFGFREGKVVAADYVSMEDGTGCVHTAPGHGQEDYLTGKKYGLEIVMPVDTKGRFDETAGKWKGMHVHDADKEIIAELGAGGLLLSTGKIEHSYPHCWRCKRAIIYRATLQWFLNIDHNDLRHRLLAEIENVRWVPAQGEERIRGMLKMRPDWCLSRQRLWGIPIPAIKCKSCKEVILAKEVIEKAAEVFKKNGSDSWFIFDIEKFLPPEFKCKCNGRNFEKEFDILDVWFESGASFFAVVKQHPDLQFPADMYLEGSDQHRGWFQVSLIPSVAKENTAPFKTILTHGFVVDGEGRKMSKSLGNVIAPQEIIKQYGAELLRLWVACSDYSEDVKISDNIIKQLVDIYRKVRNTIKFILGNLSDFDLTKDAITYAQLLEVDRFMLSRAELFAAKVTEAYENYAFYRVCQEIFNFCNLDLSAFYLDILKDRLYTFSPNSRERRSAQFVLYYILDALLKFIAPILSFTAEEAYLSWQNYNAKEVSIFVSLLSEIAHPQWLDKELNQRWEKILNLRDCVLKEIEKERTKGIIGSSLEAEVFLEFAKSDYEFYCGYADVLREIFIVSQVWIKEGHSSIRVEKTKNTKCLRCWNHRSDVGSIRDFAGVCARCADVLNQMKQQIFKPKA
jgi:isoleucyl-tRNA synthetase